jgi:hypothetical protein
MSRRNRRHVRKAFALFLLLFALSLVPGATRAQPLPWSYVVWSNGDVALAEPRVITYWGEVEPKEALEAIPPTHGVISFYVRARCWRIELRSGEFYREWRDHSACWNYYLPRVGISNRQTSFAFPKDHNCGLFSILSWGAALAFPDGSHSLARTRETTIPQARYQYHVAHGARQHALVPVAH